MGILGYALGLSALLIAPGFGAPAPEPTKAPDLAIRASACDSTYTQSDFTFDFEELKPYCASRWCVNDPVTRHNFTSDRGQGLAYKASSLQKPLMIGNAYQWQYFNCQWSELAGTDEAQACAGGSKRAIYSPGSSPYNPKMKPRLGSLDFPGDYVTWGVKSFYITPVRLPNGTTQATLELKGIREDGSQVKSSINLADTSKQKSFEVTGLDGKGFTQLKVLEFWLVAGGEGGQAFGLDDLSGIEYRPSALPASCSPPPTTTSTVDNGPCTPAPTTTTTWTADGEEFTAPTTLKSPYKSLNWNSYGISITDTSYVQPQPIPSKGKNYYYLFSGVTISADTYETRFGVQSLSAACQFSLSGDPTNKAPCTLTFTGLRDPFDGDGLPYRVEASYVIPNPGNVTTQRFTDIDLDKLTNAPGKFTRLYSFSIGISVAPYGRPASMDIDNVVFTRSIPKGEDKCRMPGARTLNFDDISVGASPVSMPEDYKGFKFSAPWAAVSKKNYEPGTPGYISAVSGQNSLRAGPDISGATFDTYINPIKNSLWTFESATFTLEPNGTAIGDVKVTITTLDTCGNLKQRNIQSDKLQYTYAEPIIGISQMQVRAHTGDYNPVVIYVDNIKWRKISGPVPGCNRCGYYTWCEVPGIPRAV